MPDEASLISGSGEELAGPPAVAGATATAPLRWEAFPADARLLVDARRALEDWAHAAGIPALTVSDVVLATYEAMANAVEHAYRRRTGTIDLLATRSEAGDVLVVVRDRGDWRPPPSDPGARGRGLLMIRSMSQAEIEPGPHGTTVSMRWATGCQCPVPTTTPAACAAPAARCRPACG